MSLSKVMEHLEAIAVRDCPYDDLTTFEKRLVILYISDVMSKDEMAWKLIQLWIDKFSRDYKMTAIPTDL